MKSLQYGLVVFFTMSTLIFVGCANTSKVKVGDTVQITYVSTFSDGSPFQSSQSTFTVGSGDTIVGLEEAVVGMKVGQTKKITITPDLGYGNLYNPFHLQKISKLLFDKMTQNTDDPSAITTIAGVTGVVKGIEKDQDGNDIILRDINPKETRQDLLYTVTLISKE